MKTRLHSADGSFLASGCVDGEKMTRDLLEIDVVLKKWLRRREKVVIFSTVYKKFIKIYAKTLDKSLYLGYIIIVG